MLVCVGDHLINSRCEENFDSKNTLEKRSVGLIGYSLIEKNLIIVGYVFFRIIASNKLGNEMESGVTPLL